MNEIKQQITEYLAYYERIRGMSPTTITTKRNVLKRFVESAKITEISDLDNSVSNAWIRGELMRGAKSQSVNTYNTTIISLVRYCRELGISVPLEITYIRKPKRARIVAFIISSRR